MKKEVVHESVSAVGKVAILKMERESSSSWWEVAVFISCVYEAPGPLVTPISDLSRRAS